MILKLKEPVSFEDKTFEEIDLDFDKFSFITLTKAEGIMRDIKEMVAPPKEGSPIYCMAVASALTKVPYKAWEKFTGDNFGVVNRIRLEVMNFLLTKGMEGTETE